MCPLNNKGTPSRECALVYIFLYFFFYNVWLRIFSYFVIAINDFVNFFLLP